MSTLRERSASLGTGDQRLWFKPVGDFHEQLTHPHGSFEAEIVRVLPWRGEFLHVLFRPPVAIAFVLLWFAQLYCVSLRLLPASAWPIVIVCLFAALALAAQLVLSDWSLQVRCAQEAYFRFA